MGRKWFRCGPNMVRYGSNRTGGLDGYGRWVKTWVRPLVDPCSDPCLDPNLPPRTRLRFLFDLTQVLLLHIDSMPLVQLPQTQRTCARQATDEVTGTQKQLDAVNMVRCGRCVFDCGGPRHTSKCTNTGTHMHPRWMCQPCGAAGRWVVGVDWVDDGGCVRGWWVVDGWWASSRVGCRWVGENCCGEFGHGRLAHDTWRRGVVRD